VGIQIYEGYGLTETSPVLTANTPSNWKIGSVGKPIPGTTIRIADDGEILAKGPQIFQGYYKNEEATSEAIDADGWFHTGDIGEIDSEGFVKITGRKKELIVTAGGKNVAPAVLEDRLRSHPLVSQAIVVGDNKPYIAAVVTIDEEQFPAWAERNGLGGRKVGDLIDDPTLLQGRDPGGRRAREQGGVEGGVDPQVRDPPAGLHHRGRRAHPDAEAQAQRRARPLRRDDRAPLRLAGRTASRRPRPPRPRTPPPAGSDRACARPSDAGAMTRPQR
jgi:hypothetical protein